MASALSGLHHRYFPRFQLDRCEWLEVMFASFCTLGAILFVTYSGMPEACGEARGEVSFRSVFGIITRTSIFVVVRVRDAARC